MLPSDTKTNARLDDEELETILAIAKNEQTGRITPFEVRELVSVYRMHADLYEALLNARALWGHRSTDTPQLAWLASVDAALRKAEGQSHGAK